MQPVELFEWLSMVVGFLVSLCVLLFALVAYRRTRIRRLAVFTLLSALLATTFGLDIVEELAEGGSVYIDVATSAATLSLAVVLLVTVVYRVEWRRDR